MNEQSNTGGGGWLKLYRDIRKSPVWIDSTPEQKVVLITLLTMASHKNNEWLYKGELYAVKPGQVITSVQNIVKECGNGLTVRKVRTAIKRLEKYQFLTTETTNKNTLVTILNWGKYQDYTEESDKQVDKQVTSKRQTSDKQVTTIKNEKNIRSKEVKNSISIPNGIDCCTDVQCVASEWNTLEVYGIKKVVKIASGTKRHNALRARIKQYGLDAVINAIDNIRSSDFLQGKNNKGWVITFDWFVLPNNFIKVLEGNYNNTISQSNKTESTGNPFLDELRRLEEEERRKKGDIIDV